MPRCPDTEVGELGRVGGLRHGGQSVLRGRSSWTLAYFSRTPRRPTAVSAVMASGSPSSSSSSVAVASKKASVVDEILDDHARAAFHQHLHGAVGQFSEAAAHWPARHAGRCRHGWGRRQPDQAGSTGRICLSSCITSSRARTDFSRPTKSGTIMWGKNHDVAQRQNRIGGRCSVAFCLPRCLGRKPRTPFIRQPHVPPLMVPDLGRLCAGFNRRRP